MGVLDWTSKVETPEARSHPGVFFRRKDDIYGRDSPAARYPLSGIRRRADGGDRDPSRRDDRPHPGILRPEADSRLRLVDAETGELVLSNAELEDRLRSAEAELARLRREGRGD